MSIGIFIYSLMVCFVIFCFGCKITNTNINGTKHEKIGLGIVFFDMILFIVLMTLAFSFTNYRHLIESFKHDDVIALELNYNKKDSANIEEENIIKLEKQGYNMVHSSSYIEHDRIFVTMIFVKDKPMFSERYDNFIKIAEDNN